MEKKRILITGKNSYVGVNFKNWLAQWPENYEVEEVSVRGEEWKKKDFSKFDTVLHVAGIAHIKETKENQSLYYKVNKHLAYEIAKKAKEAGVRQFVFLSSMSVYGIDNGIIYKNTPLKPLSAYGKSKLEAEELIKKLQDSTFIVSTIRPPMIYGKGCRGNYPKLARLALKTPFFLNVSNKRSMIYIDNLCEFIKKLIDNHSEGLFFPQNNEYVNTTEMVRLIAEFHEKNILMTKVFNPLLNLLKVRMLNKVFGDLVYDMKISEYQSEYRVCGFEKSIALTESGSSE